MRASHNPADLLSHNSSLLTQEGKTFLLDSNVVEARGVGELTKPVLQVLKEVDKTTAFSKDVLQYTFNVKNTGDGTWYGTLEDVLPEKDLNYVAHSTKVNTKAITDKLWETAEDLAVSDEKVWNDNRLRYLVTLKPGRELKLSFKTKIVKEEDGKIVNRFSGINAENPDFNKDSNTVETQVHVRKLVVSKAVDKAEAKTGDTLTYKLTVENTGTAKWVGTLTDKLTDDLQALKTDVGSFDGNTLSVPIDLDQGQTQVITFTAKVLRKKAGEILNHASVTHENMPELNVESNEVKTVVEEEPDPTPTEPEDKPDEPEPTPTEPEEKPDEPEPTPTEPEEKPDEPDPTPTEPEDKPDKPEPTPTEPEDKPDEPEPTPTDPEDKPDKPEPTPTEPEDKPDKPAPTPTEPEDKPDKPDPTPTEPEDKPDEPEPTPTEPEDKPDKPDPTPTEPEDKPDKPDPTPTEPEDKPDEPEPTPTEPEDKPDEPDPTPTEPEDKPDEPEPTPTEPGKEPEKEPEKDPEPGKESDNDKQLPNKENQGKPNKQTGAKVSKPKQIPATKAKAKNDLPAAGTKQNGYLWLGVVSLGLAGIMIYFDKKSRWHH
nr:hypothetical protein [Enterococcus cecorum]